MPRKSQKGPITPSNVEKRPREKTSDDEKSPESKKMNTEFQNQLKEMMEGQTKEIRHSAEEGQKKLRAHFDEKLDEVSNYLNLKIGEVTKKVDEISNDVENLRTSVNTIKKAVDENRASLSYQKRSIDSLKMESNRHEQAVMIRDAVISGLPIITRENVKSIMEKLSILLAVRFNEADYTAYQRKVNGKNMSNIYVSFNNLQLKKDIREKYKQMKKAADCLMLVEKLIDLPPDSRFNGKKFSILNKLTKMNMDILNEARKHPNVFQFSYDSDDGHILVRYKEKIVQVNSIQHVKQLVESAGLEDRQMDQN